MICSGGKGYEKRKPYDRKTVPSGGRGRSWLHSTSHLWKFNLPPTVLQESLGNSEGGIFMLIPIILGVVIGILICGAWLLYLFIEDL